MSDERAVILPPGVDVTREKAAAGTIVNETELPDQLVHHAVSTYFEEHASLLGVGQGSQFQSYTGPQGSLLARRRGFQTPQTPIEEVILARDLAERDDDVAATIGAMIAVAFGDGMLNTHVDEITVALFDEIAKHANLDHVLAEMYRELLIASSITTVSLFTREDFQFQPQGNDRQRTRSVVAPMLGVLPAELLRIVDNDMFGSGRLAYKPATGQQETWLNEYFGKSTTAARRREMQREDPVLTALMVGQIAEKEAVGLFSATNEDPNYGNHLYLLNPRMVHRSTFPKGAWRYPRPLLTGNFPLLEAKRLLNLMDYALLQGGSNFLVVAKKGSDQRPALQPEVDNLREIISRASYSGVVVGDHRIDIEIITPDLKELLNPGKRKLIGRKLASRLLRIPDFVEEESGGGNAVLAGVEMISRVISSDRRLIRRHIETAAYDEAVKRNTTQFVTGGAASIWFPKIILQGANFFQDFVLALRDRGDIPRRYAVEAGGFDYNDAVAQRKREKASGDDRVMTPAAVPFSGAGAGGGSPGPQDRGGGRPPGSGPDNGAPGARGRSKPAQARPRRTIHQNPGETVKAMFDDDLGTYRVGEITYGVLEQYEDTKKIGRVTLAERRACEELGSIHRAGAVTVIPVNPEDELEDLKAVRLSTGVSMIVGNRDDDGAVMARALCFREPEYDRLAAEETAIAWGFYIEELEREPRRIEAPEDEPPAPVD